MFELYYGKKPTGFAVCHDDIYPEMWRIHYPDGHISDIVNQTRAKDAALAICKRRMAGDRNGGVKAGKGATIFTWRGRGHPSRGSALDIRAAPLPPLPGGPNE